MIKRVFDAPGSPPYYVCTLCSRPFQALHQANEHANYCDQAVPTQPVFRSYTTAALPDDDDDTQVYKKPWVGLTDGERDAITDKVIGFNSCCGWEDDYAKAIEAALKKKNT